VVVLAWIALAGGLAARRPLLIGCSAALLAAAYGLTLDGRGGGIDAGSLLVAGWLFLCADLGILATETPGRTPLPWRHLAGDAAVGLGSAVTGVVLLGINQSIDLAGPLLTAAGVAAALLLLALLAASAVRRAV
jgi:hypothetical protein